MFTRRIPILLTALLCVVFAAVPVYAQSTFDLKMENNYSNGDTICMTIWMKSNNALFELGDSELFFDYNPSVLDEPFVMESYNYIGNVTNTDICPSGFCIYSPTHSLNNTPGRTGLVLDFGAGTGATVPDSFIKVMQVCFEVLDTTKGVNLSWRNSMLLESPSNVKKDDNITNVPSDSLEGFNGQANPFPVEYAYFEAKAKASHIALDWATTYEHNSTGIALQRKGLGEDFVTIEHFATTGDTEEGRLYSFEDTDVIPGFSYVYRLRQTDQDGAVHDSRQIEIGLMPDEDYLKMSKAYPNPTSDQTSVELYSSDYRDIQIRIFNSLGQLYKKEIYQLVPGKQKIDFDLRDATRGALFIQFQYKTSQGVELITRTIIRN